MTFGDAIAAAKEGARITRDGWNGKGQFVYYQPGSNIRVKELRCKTVHDWAKEIYMYGDEGVIKINGHFDMINAEGEIVVGWLASQTDMLAEDWRLWDD